MASEYAGLSKITDDMLASPTLPGLLNLAGINELGGSPDIRWECCGIYSVKIGRGLYSSEMPRRPTPRGYSISKSVVKVGEPGEEVFNIFSWDIAAAALGPDGSSIVALKGNAWSKARAASIDKYSGPASSSYEGKLPLGGYVELEPPLRVLEGSDILEMDFNDVIVASPKGGGPALFVPLSLPYSVKLRTGTYDVRASVLFPLAYFSLRYWPGDQLETNSLVVRGAREPIFISSSEPITVSFDEGSVTVRLRGPAYIGVGDEPHAFRSLLQLALRPSGAVNLRLGSVEPGAASAIIESLSIEDRRASALIAIINPTNYDSQFTARFAWSLESGELCSPLGCYTIPGSRLGLLRAPAPRGCYCEASISLKNVYMPDASPSVLGTS